MPAGKADSSKGDGYDIKQICTLFLGLALAVSTGPALAESGDEQQCIYLSYIDRTPVIDNKTILVEMKGNGGYKRIDLINRCSGLKLMGGFSLFDVD